MEPCRVCRPVVPYQICITLMRIRIKIRIEVKCWIRIRIEVKSWIRIRIEMNSLIRIRIKVMLIRNPASKAT
jgi:hypothetical protein